MLIIFLSMGRLSHATVRAGAAGVEADRRPRNFYRDCVPDLFPAGLKVDSSAWIMSSIVWRNCSSAQPMSKPSSKVSRASCRSSAKFSLSTLIFSTQATGEPSGALQMCGVAGIRCAWFMSVLSEDFALQLVGDAGDSTTRHFAEQFTTITKRVERKWVGGQVPACYRPPAAGAT